MDDDIVCTVRNYRVIRLDGFAKVHEYAEYQKQINQKYLCISDHGVMGAVPQQITESEKHNLFPLFAIEFYVNPMQPKFANRGESVEYRKSLGDLEIQKKFDKSCHLLGIAYNYVGYSNLVKLSSWAWIHGFYRKPRINHEILMQHKEGIIFTSTCASSEIARAFFAGGDDAGFQMVEKYMAMFGEYFYLELMMLDYKAQKPYDAFLIRAHDKYHIPLIMTQDCHYCRKEHSTNQRLMLMQQTKKTLKEVQLMVDAGKEDEVFELQDSNLWLKSEDELNEMWELKFQDTIDYDLFKQSKANTVKIAEFAKGVQLNREIKLPKIPDADTILWEEIKKGFIQRNCPKTPDYSKRIKEEYDLISEKGFSSYFLIQKMMLDEARKVSPNILGFGDGSEAIGPGRGCLTSYTPIRLISGRCLPISEVKVGDQVFTRNGKICRVLKIMTYPLNNEKMRCIKTYYGDSIGVGLTLDHEVLVEKCRRPKNWESWSESTKKSRKSFEEPLGDLQWLASKEVEVGDWCFVPIPKIDVLPTLEVDLSKFSEGEFKNGKKLLCDDLFVRHEFNSKSGGRKMRVMERYWKLDVNWARALGVFAGDGWTRKIKANQVGFCDIKSAGVHLNFVQELAESHGLNCSRNKQGDKDVEQLIINSPYMEELFNMLHPDYKHTPETKHVPFEILYGDVELVKAYLHGYFSADGSEGENKVKFETVSLMLAEQIRFLLLRIGLPSSIAKSIRTDSRPGFTNVKPSYIINCPLDERLGCRRNTLSKYVWKSVEGGLLLKVREISEIEGIDVVYDLEIEENHNYLTSSFLVHNSVCGSLVAYCLRLHDVEPMIHDLKFSRFLSPARGGKQMRIRHTIDPIPHEEIIL